MPSDGLYFEAFPTANSAMLGCIVLCGIVFVAQVLWCLLCDDDQPPRNTVSGDDVLRAIANSRLHELEQEADWRDNL